MPGYCTRCQVSKEYGHRDPDNFFWYCEDCWLSFGGRRRRCAMCKLPKDEGHVDQSVEYWYCLPCWEIRRAPPPGYPPPHHGYWPPPVAHGYPPPFGYPPPGHPGFPALPAPSSRPSRSRSRSRDGGKGRRRKGGKGGERSDGGKKEFKPYHATSVPKANDLSAKFNSDSPPTTAMLRNIPNKFTQNSLLEEIDQEGFVGLYDFFYLPMDVRNKTNVGYAFINFLDSADMSRFKDHFEGYQFKKYHSQKIATVSPAHVQGLNRNIQQLTKKAVLTFNDGEYKPIVLRNGVRIDFEDAAKDLE
eukprot:gb/GFBE01018520.1/.p1 GENE.gb/GFBE01018520.1/~~gb/GFBE01018520.1/.p1  ORF type:complete len:302 (+),score=23.70 gb/GFBE01018520.1/:1-906(+)